MTAPAVPTMTPPLRDGERLTSDEFFRRYLAMPDVKKAELIEGVVCMPSPVSAVHHSSPHGDLNGFLWVYTLHTPGVTFAADSTVLLDDDNVPQPDGQLYVEREGRFAEGGYVAGAPELIAEVSASSASRDRNAKSRAYQRNGVREYVIWRTLDAVIEWFVLREGRYEALLAGEDGIIRSEVFPGLWLDVAAMLRRDKTCFVAVLMQGIASQAHAEFVAQLQAGT